MINTRVMKPKNNGTTTKRTVDSNKVAKGTLTLSTPNKKATIGANNTRIIKSLIAT